MSFSERTRLHFSWFLKFGSLCFGQVVCTSVLKRKSCLGHCTGKERSCLQKVCVKHWNTESRRHKSWFHALLQDIWCTRKCSFLSKYCAALNSKCYCWNVKSAMDFYFIFLLKNKSLTVVLLIHFYQNINSHRDDFLTLFQN